MHFSMERFPTTLYNWQKGLVTLLSEPFLLSQYFLGKNGIGSRQNFLNFLCVLLSRNGKQWTQTPVWMTLLVLEGGAFTFSASTIWIHYTCFNSHWACTLIPDLAKIFLSKVNDDTKFKCGWALKVYEHLPFICTIISGEVRNISLFNFLTIIMTSNF